MCRQIAFLNTFPKNDAIDCIHEFIGNNEDGFGYAYIKDNQFIVRKWKESFNKVIKKRSNKVFEHLKDKSFSGWTIAHVRMGSVGEICKKNSHPHVTQDNKWCVTHNGGFGEHSLVRSILGKTIKFKGTTDSEVAAELISLIGINRFIKEVSFAGVYFCLNRRSQNLHVIKSSGDATLATLEDGSPLIASELDTDEYENSEELEAGNYCFNPSGQLIQSIPKYKSVKVINCSNLNNKKEKEYEKTLVFNHRDSALYDDCIMSNNDPSLRRFCL